MDSVVAPSMKEIIIKSPDDLKTVHEFLMNEGAGQLIGFSTLNQVMDAQDISYMFYKPHSRVTDFIMWAQATQKYILRFTGAFLMRNWMDTVNQWMSDIYHRQGLHGLWKDKEVIWNIIRLPRYGI